MASISGRTDEYLPVFGLQYPDSYLRYLQITAGQYDETLKAYPSDDVALTWYDQDDGEEIRIGSGNELKERLEESVLVQTTIPLIHDLNTHEAVDRYVHIFDVGRSHSQRQAWRARQLDYEQACWQIWPSDIQQSDYIEAANGPFEDTTITVSSTGRGQISKLVSPPINPQTTVHPKPDLTNILGEAFGIVADVLQITSTVLRKAADVSRETDTSAIEDVLSGMKSIIGEAGALSLSLFDKVKNDAACSEQNQAISSRNSSVEVIDPSPSTTIVKPSQNESGTAITYKAEDHSNIQANPNSIQAPPQRYNYEFNNLTPWWERSSSDVESKVSTTSEGLALDKQSTDYVEQLRMLDQECKCRSEMLNHGSTCDPDIQALEHQPTNSRRHSNMIPPTSESVHFESPRNSRVQREDTIQQGSNQCPSVSFSNETHSHPINNVPDKNMDIHSQTGTPLTHIPTSRSTFNPAVNFTYAEASILDQDADDVAFHARYPPLKSIPRAKTVSFRAGNKQQQSSTIARSNSLGRSDFTKSVSRPSPHVFDAETARRREFARSCYPNQRDVPTSEDTKQEKFGGSDYIFFNSKTTANTSQAPVQKDNAKIVGGEDSHVGSQNTVPGAWPTASPSQNDQSGAESSGAFFNRMIDQAAHLKQTFDLRKGDASIARHSSLRDASRDVLRARGLRRSQTVVSANPAARLNSPFDPMMPVATISETERKISEKAARRAEKNKSILRPARPRTFLEPTRPFSPVWEDESSSSKRTLHSAKSSATLRPSPQAQSIVHDEQLKRMRSVPVFRREANPIQESGRLDGPAAQPMPPRFWEMMTQPVGVNPALGSDLTCQTSANLNTTAVTTPTVTQAAPDIDKCVSQLQAMGYGFNDSALSSRLEIYAAAADGDVIEAMELIEADQEASAQDEEAPQSNRKPSSDSHSRSEEDHELQKVLDLSKRESMKNDEEMYAIEKWEQDEFERVLRNSQLEM